MVESRLPLSSAGFSSPAGRKAHRHSWQRIYCLSRRIWAFLQQCRLVFVYREDMTVEQKTSLAAVITIDQETMHGTPCFSGTRDPVQTLLDFLETGESIDDFLAVYPYIPRRQGLAFLEDRESVV